LTYDEMIEQLQAIRKQLLEIERELRHDVSQSQYVGQTVVYSEWGYDCLSQAMEMVFATQQCLRQAVVEAHKELDWDRFVWNEGEGAMHYNG
jgi:allophanate hydrolase subunit 1